jgi:hypothetical protein
MARLSLLKAITMIAFTGQLLIVPWKQHRSISDPWDSYFETSTTYRPIFSPPRSILYPEIDVVRLVVQLGVTMAVAWILTRFAAQVAVKKIP